MYAHYNGHLRLTNGILHGIHTASEVEIPQHSCPQRELLYVYGSLTYNVRIHPSYVLRGDQEQVQVPQNDNLLYPTGQVIDTYTTDYTITDVNIQL
jgi:hypothetical protein